MSKLSNRALLDARVDLKGGSWFGSVDKPDHIDSGGPSATERRGDGIFGDGASPQESPEHRKIGFDLVVPDSEVTFWYEGAILMEQPLHFPNP